MAKITTREYKGSGAIWLSLVNYIAKPSGKTCLDLCCCEMTHTKQLGFSWLEGVDCVDWKTRPKEFKFHLMDVLDFARGELRHFDVSICSDGIEHLPKEKGFELIAEMIRISDTVIIFTPTKFVENSTTPHDGHPDRHKSLWSVDDFDGSWSGFVFPNWHEDTGEMLMWRTK